MGKVVSTFIKRPARNWNVENRAIREIERRKDKPLKAPLHPTTQESIQDFQRNNPDLLDAQKIKDDALHQRLHGMVVNPEKMPEPKLRALPEERKTPEDPIYGYLEPTHISPGKCSIRQALEFIGNHHMDANNNTAADIARSYKLTSAEVQQVLKYYKPLQVQIPKIGQASSLQEGPKASVLNSETLRNLLRSGSRGGPDSKT